MMPPDSRILTEISLFNQICSLWQNKQVFFLTNLTNRRSKSRSLWNKTRQNDINQKNRSRHLARIAIADFLFYLSSAAFYPYLQIILRNNGYHHSSVGLILAIGEAASVVIPLLVANLADRTGKRRLCVIFCILLAILLFVPVSTSTTAWITILAMFFCRGLYSCLNPLLDSIATTYLEGDSSKYSTVRTIGTLGYVLACFFFGLSGIIQSGNNTTILKTFIICGTAFGVYCLTLPKMIDSGIMSRRIAKGDIKVYRHSDDHSRPRYGSPYEKSFVIFIIATFFLKLGNSAIERLLSSYMTEVMKLGDNFINYVALGSTAEIAIMLLSGYLIKKKNVPPTLLVILGGLGLCARLLIYAVWSSMPAFIIAQLLHGLTFGATQIGSVMFIAKSVPKENASMAMSIYTCIGTSLPNTIGSLLGGWIIESQGYEMMFVMYSAFALVGTMIFIITNRSLSVKK